MGVTGRWHPIHYEVGYRNEGPAICQWVQEMRPLPIGEAHHRPIDTRWDDQLAIRNSIEMQTYEQVYTECDLI